MKLLKHLLLCVFLLSVIGCVSPPDPTLTVVRYNYYFVLLPQDYEGQGDCPMIFYLHGEGYETTDLGVLTSYGLGKYVEEHGDFPFVVVAPVYTQDWETELLDQVLDEVTAEYHIDLDRRYAARELIDILRARTFPPHPGAYYMHGGRKIYLRLHLMYEDQLDRGDEH